MYISTIKQVAYKQIINSIIQIDKVFEPITIC